MVFKQYRHEPLGQASYLVGCSRAKTAVVVDPIADLGAEFYVIEAADLTLEIVGALETHVHADYVSAARELAGMVGGAHYLHASAPVKYPFEPLEHGQRVEVGEVVIEAIHTPGHTPEHTAYLVTDTGRSDEPWFVLTGDSLFVGDVGRPDLLVGDQALDVIDRAERARLQYRSIRDKLFTLPDSVEVYPNHYGVSACGGVNMSGKVSSTIGFERKFNVAMAQADEDAFAAFVAETAKPLPDDYRRIKATNLGLDPAEAQGVGSVTPAEVKAAIADGAVPIDLRTPRPFAEEHLPGAVNLQFNRADLADRAEMLLPAGQRYVLNTHPDAIAKMAVGILREAGFHVEGYLDGGFDAWRSAGFETETLPTLSVRELHERQHELTVVDVREGFEFRHAHVPGAVLVPWTQTWERKDELPDDRTLAIVCGDEVRSSAAASVLKRTGYEPALVLGGMVDWMEAEYPVEKTAKGAFSG